VPAAGYSRPVRRWRLPALGVTPGVLLLAANASASHDASGGPAEDFATGGANIFEQFIGASFDAHSGPNGENPTGTGSAGVRSTYYVNGPVTCLSVSGNRATIAFAVDQDSSITVPEHRGHLIYVEDNGSPGGGQDLANQAPTTDVVHVCSPPTDEQLVPFPWIPIRPQPIQSGDVVVHDFVALPRPAAKDECKNAGWQQFDFDNQGQCIAFVERGSRP
jgi:hypothetical protein